MARRIAVALSAALVATVGLVASPAYADELCVRRPRIGIPMDNGYIAPMTNTDRSVPILMLFDEWEMPADHCNGAIATLQKADGSLRRTATFTDNGGTGHPPLEWAIANATIPLANGAGDWVITSISHGSDTLAVSVPFTVSRGSAVTLEQPARVTAPAKTTVQGRVGNYDGTTAMAPSHGRVVRLYSVPPGQSYPRRLLGSTKTDAAGRYRFQLPISAPVGFLTAVSAVPGYSDATSRTVTARVLASLSPLTASPRAYIGRWWGVSGRAAPVRLLTHLLRWDGSQWVDTHSFGTPAADTTFTRWWKPTTAGGYRMRVELTGSGPDNTPLAREIGVTVSARPAYLTGTAGATSATVIRAGTRMSTFGRLSAMYTTGATGPFAGQRVLVQTRPRGRTALPYTTVATATTSSTGYYYVNWTVRSDVDVRVAFVSPYQSVGSAFRYVRAVDVR